MTKQGIAWIADSESRGGSFCGNLLFMFHEVMCHSFLKRLWAIDCCIPFLVSISV